MRLDQSASEAATLTLARPLATRTDNVSYHVEENLVLDQWLVGLSPAHAHDDRSRYDQSRVLDPGGP